MKLKDYLAIAGEQGLFRFIAQGRNAIIVEHLESGKRTSAHSSAKVSSLEDISIFTVSEDLPLSKVFDTIYEKEKGGPAPDAKSDIEKLKAYFLEIVPDYDKDRVYSSDIKKVMQWYNALHKLDLLVVEDEPKDEETTPKQDTDLKATASAKPKTGSKPKPKTQVKGKTESKSAATRSKGGPKVK